MEYTFIFPSPRPNGSSSIHVERHWVTCIALPNSSGQTGYKHRVKLLLLFCEWVLISASEGWVPDGGGWGLSDGDRDGLSWWRKAYWHYFLVTTPTSRGIIAAIKVLLYNCFSVLDPYNGNGWGARERTWARFKKLNKGWGRRCCDCQANWLGAVQNMEWWRGWVSYCTSAFIDSYIKLGP